MSAMAGSLNINKNVPISPIYFFCDKEPMHSVAFIQNGDELLLCGTESGFVSFWDLTTLRPSDIKPLPVGPTQCNFIGVYDNKLITQDKAGIIKCWIKSDKWYEKTKVELDYIGFCKISVSIEHKTIACPYNQSVVKIYDLELNYISKFETDKAFGSVMSCQHIEFKDRYFLLVAYEGGSILLWNFDDNVQVGHLNLPKLTPFTIDFDSIQGRGLCGTNAKKLPVFELGDDGCLSCVHTIKIKNSGVSCVKIHSTKDIVAVGCWDCAIRIFSWTTYELTFVLLFHSMSVEDLSFSPNKCSVLDCEGVLAAVSRDKKISLWNVKDLCLSK